MNTITVRVRGKRGVQRLPSKPSENPLLDKAARSSDEIFAPVLPHRQRKLAPKPTGDVETLLVRLDKAMRRQAAATTTPNRRTQANRAKQLRQRLRLLGVEFPPDRSKV